MGRKTFDVVSLVEEVNKRNRLSICSEEMRKGWNDLMSYILSQTNNYAGYTYLTEKEVPNGEKPGVILGETPDKNEFPDESRVYWLSVSLKG